MHFSECDSVLHIYCGPHASHEGVLFVASRPVATTEFDPIVTRKRIITLVPIKQLSSIIIQPNLYKFKYLPSDSLL